VEGSPLHGPLPAEAAQEANPPTTPTGSAPSAATAPPTLRQGATGAPVRAWQERLCALGYEPGKADGAFGPKTLAATQAFQASRGLASSGVVDAATWAEGYQAAHKDMTLSRVMLARAQRDVGLREEGANNHGARVEQYQATVGIAPGSDYCAAAVCTWLTEASKATGIPRPIALSAAAKGLEANLRDVKPTRWTDKAKLAGKIAPGWIVVWDRSHAEPWQGHVGLVETVSPDGRTFGTIEANITMPETAPTGGVARRTHTLDEPLLRGAGTVD
jgi:hypothetical protein